MGACRILIAVFFMLEFFHVQLVSIGFGTWKVRASIYLTVGYSQSVTDFYGTSPDQLTELSCLLCNWQHYALLIVAGEINFFIAEDLVLWFFQPEHIVTVTMAHMAAIITALLPFFALSIVLVRSYVHEGKEVDVASLGGTFHHVDLTNGTGATKSTEGLALQNHPVWEAKVILAAQHWNSKAHLGARAQQATVRGFAWFFWGIVMFVSATARYACCVEADLFLCRVLHPLRPEECHSGVPPAVLRVSALLLI